MSVEHLVGLRERKKQKTRLTIVKVALELFAEQGYQRTTIAQIAHAAEVSPRTVSTYFPAKEELVFDLNGASKERLTQAIRDRPSGTNTMEALRAWLLAETEVWREMKEELTCQRQIIDQDEGLLAYEQAQMRGLELLLVEGLAADLGMEEGDLEPRMAGAAAIAVFDLLSTERHEAGHDTPDPEVQLQILDRALTFITGGVTALREAGDNGS